MFKPISENKLWILPNIMSGNYQKERIINALYFQCTTKILQFQKCRMQNTKKKKKRKNVIQQCSKSQKVWIWVVNYYQINRTIFKKNFRVRRHSFISKNLFDNLSSVICMIPYFNLCLFYHKENDIFWLPLEIFYFHE